MNGNRNNNKKSKNKKNFFHIAFSISSNLSGSPPWTQSGLVLLNSLFFNYQSDV
jgi:hypothetical protein